MLWIQIGLVLGWVHAGQMPYPLLYHPRPDLLNNKLVRTSLCNHNFTDVCATNIYQISSFKINVPSDLMYSSMQKSNKILTFLHMDFFFALWFTIHVFKTHPSIRLKTLSLYMVSPNFIYRFRRILA